MYVLLSNKIVDRQVIIELQPQKANTLTIS